MSREACLHCFRVLSLCLCGDIQAFSIEPLIVLLVHPREFMKTVGTVRLVRLSLTGSVLLRGHGKDFDQDPVLRGLIEDSGHQCLILFPGPESLNLTTAPVEKIKLEIPQGKRLVIFVLDGTWSAAKNMIRKSKVLSSLSMLSFEVSSPSIYEIRKQPKLNCLSTVEAVSLLIENLSQHQLCSPKPTGGHLKMVEVFKKLIASQLLYEGNPKHRHARRFRKPKSEGGPRKIVSFL